MWSCVILLLHEVTDSDSKRKPCNWVNWNIAAYCTRLSLCEIQIECVFLCEDLKFEWYGTLHRGFLWYCCALHKNYYNHHDTLDSWSYIVYNGFTIKLLDGPAMLKTPELAMPRSRKVTTVCNGRREVWSDYEQAKAYFLEMMMSTDGEEHERAECVYIQLLHVLDECSDEDE